MKIIVLHGDDTGKSYERLKKFIDVAHARSWEVSYLDETDQKIEEVLSTSSLFGNERFFIIRNIKKITKKELAWINKRYKNLMGNLIIYNDGVINKSFINNLPKESKIEEFKLPVLIWNFLDGLYPGNLEKSIADFHKIINKEPVEFIFALIARHFRDLCWVKIDTGSTGFPSWKMSKLKSQSLKFSENSLKKIINLLAKIDLEVKTSKTDVTSELDLLMIKHLE